MTKKLHQDEHNQGARNGVVGDRSAPPSQAVPPSVAFQLQLLDNACAATRASAAGQLGQMPPHTPAVTKALGMCAIIDPNEAVRQAARNALAAIQARAAAA